MSPSNHHTSCNPQGFQYPLHRRKSIPQPACFPYFDRSMRGYLRWHIRGHWGPRNLSKANLGPDWSLGPISRAPVALDVGIQGKHVGSVADLSRHSGTEISHLRACHAPLSTFLYCINAIENPNFQDCGKMETTKHFALLCRKFTPQRKALFNQLWCLKLDQNTQTFLTNPKAFKPLANLISATKHFLQVWQWYPP